MRNRIRLSKRVFGLAALMLALIGRSLAAGLDTGVKQLIVSVAPAWDSSTGKLQRFERSGEGWKPAAPPVEVLYGKNGLVWGRGLFGTDEPGPHKQERDGRAPAGVFRIGTIYTYDSALPDGAKYPFHTVGAGDAWIDDSTSLDYNKHVVIDPARPPSWFDKQKMRHGDFAYRWLVEIRHNSDPPVANAGSAIFFHIRRGPARQTAGCTTMAESDLVKMIRWLRADERPCYALLPRAEYLAKWKAWGLPSPQGSGRAPPVATPSVVSYQPIENYGVIGDLHTVALVGMDGSIDFMCFPRFDSPSIFAAILDDEKGGRFQIAPKFNDARHRQLYLPDTNILLTRFLSGDGVAEVSDFMPVAEKRHGHQLIRRAKTVRGEVDFHMVCAPAFNYGRSSHRIELRDNMAIFSSDGDQMIVRLHADVPMRIENSAVVADFTLGPGETASFIFEDAKHWPETLALSPGYVAEVFKETMNFWRGWIRQSTYRGRWREMVNRSALTLKLLTSHPDGAIVAAPTFGLPEEIGGVRNWDYRFTWIRDASFTLYGLMRLGYTAEAKAFMGWIEQRCHEMNPDGSLQLMYALDGTPDVTERELPHFEGYRKSAPVRIGNGASGQLQLDIYGELMDSVYLYNKYGEPISYDFWMQLTRLVEFVCANWQRPDEGIWEVRGGQQEFTYSRVMCWVAVDRAIRLAQKRSFPAPLDRWHQVRDNIYRDVYENLWCPDRKTFLQHKGSSAVDASCLLMPLVKFIGPTDPRWISTLKAIEESLVEDSLVYRYNTCHSTPDGLSGSEGTFSMCSFWFVECLSRGGDVEKARFIFEKNLGYANHLGLYAEELGPRGEHLGNFPQAFTHLALISAACNLNEKLSSPNG